MSSSPTRGKRPEDMLNALEPETSGPRLHGVLFYIFFLILVSVSEQPISPVFTQTLKSKFNSPFFTSLKSFVRRKLIPVFDPRPLCYSSLTTEVGGI